MPNNSNERTPFMGTERLIRMTAHDAFELIFTEKRIAVSYAAGKYIANDKPCAIVKFQQIKDSSGIEAGQDLTGVDIELIGAEVKLVITSKKTVEVIKNALDRASRLLDESPVVSEEAGVE